MLFIHGGGSKDNIDRHSWPFPKYLKEKFGTVPDAFHMVLSSVLLAFLFLLSNFLLLELDNVIRITRSMLGTQVTSLRW